MAAVFAIQMAAPALAQLATSTLVGRVVDDLGSCVSGVRITLRSEGGYLREATLGPTCEFSFSGLPVGEYEVQAELEGFSVSSVRVRLDVARSTEVVIRFPGDAGIAQDTITVTDSAAADSILWNLWAEEASQSGVRFRPIEFLRPGNQRHQLVLDLATAAYGGGVVAVPLGESAIAEICSHLDDAADPLFIDVMLVVDEGFFRPPRENVRQLEVDVGKLRTACDRVERAADDDAVEAGDAEGEPLETLRGLAARGAVEEAAFRLGGISFILTTRQLTGNGWFGLSLWHEGKFLGDIESHLCIATSRGDAEARCAASPGTQSLRGVDSVRLALERTSYAPVAALHLFKIDPRLLKGMLWVAAEPGGREELLTWDLELDTALETALEQVRLGFEQAMHDPRQFARAGQRLFDVLLPRAGRTQRARSAMERLAARADAANPPALFIRMPSAGEDEPLLLPLGLAAIPQSGGDPIVLGSRFRIESPLEFKSYEPGEGCLRHWLLVVPERDWDSSLNAALDMIEPLIDRWRTRAVVEPLLKLGETELAPETTARASSALLILAHYDSKQDGLYQRDGEYLYPSDLYEDFAHPSVAILNACKTGAAGLSGFVRRLNVLRVASIVTTTVEIDPVLAADFMVALDAELESSTQPRPLSTVVHNGLRRLAGMPSPSGVPWGPRAYVYSLLGSGSPSLCAPRKDS